MTDMEKDVTDALNGVVDGSPPADITHEAEGKPVIRQA
jgi:hypothetical protein